MPTETPTLAPKRRDRQPEPAALRAPDAASFCGVSSASWARLHSASLIPAPVRLGGCVLWSRRELEAFLLAGAPSREVWSQIRSQWLRPQPI